MRVVRISEHEEVGHDWRCCDQVRVETATLVGVQIQPDKGKREGEDGTAVDRREVCSAGQQCVDTSVAVVREREGQTQQVKRRSEQTSQSHPRVCGNKLD